MTPQERVIQTAKNELGYHESGKNITKYAQDFDTKYPNFYNTKKQGAEWCDIFYDWCMVTTFGEDIGRQMLYQPWKSAGAGCKFSAQYYKDNKAFYKTPEIGDQIFFYVGGEINHTGRVIAVTSTTVTTIEGNAGNEVRQNTYKLSASNIAGYGRPKWSLAGGGTETVNIEMNILQKGSKGEQVKTYQVMMNTLNIKGANGKALSVDKDYGNNCVYACKTLQKKLGLAQTGICDQAIWDKLLKG